MPKEKTAPGYVMVKMKPELRRMLEMICEDTATAEGNPGMSDMVRLLIFTEFKRRKLKLEGQ